MYSCGATPNPRCLARRRELGTGRTNHNFIATSVADASKRYFVRVGSDLPVYGVTRAREQAAARAAADASIAPAVLYTASDAMVTGFVEGRTLTEKELKDACAGTGDPSLLAEVAATLRTMHALPAPPELASARNTESTWPPADLWRWIALAEEKGFDRLPLLGDARPFIASLESVASAGATPSQECFCHFDLLPDNLIRTPPGPARSVHVVDFEYAGVGQPLMDLAIMSMGCALSGEEETALLTAYNEAPPSAELQRAFSALKVLACLRETMWGVVAEVSGASALPMEEAISYGDENFAKLQKFRAEFEAAEQQANA